MARTFRRREPLSALSEINVTPLIDLAFALLIIFMITAPLLEQSIAVNLPEEAVDPTPSTREEAVQEVSIDAAGVVYWGAQAIELERLDEELAALAVLPEPPILSIRADREQTVQRLVDVLDLVKKHKLKRVSLETRVR
ncbi:MAG: ExbD/TolR family protein [Opitutales bacterium]